MAKKEWKILLLTNRDSDNVGDQVIEACDISLISAVMKNLGIEDDRYVIISHGGGAVSKKYLDTQNERLYKRAEKLISDSDIIIFGGAPMFNYSYQIFYERTATTLEIAEKYHKPVMFSAIGVEGYDENNKKCQRLKKTLNFDCVKQITTRDDFDSLKKFINNENIIIDKVSDPAVFASKVFDNFITSDKKRNGKKVGIFILRANGFTDNKIDFSRDDAAVMWQQLSVQLKKKKYDYEFLTSGHFGDEAFLDYLIRNYNINVRKCVFNINTPEKLLHKISSCDIVVTCRLHPSIISFSLGVPSLGIVWNSKVKHFYNSIGYEDRIIDINTASAEEIMEKLGQITEQNEGVKKDKDYLMSVYRAMFCGIKGIVCAEEDGIENRNPYSYEELMEKIPLYQGTTQKEYEKKEQRKLRRIYGKYNELFEKNLKNDRYTLIYNGGSKSSEITWSYDEAKGEIQKLDSGSVEYRLKEPVINNGKTEAIKNGFSFSQGSFVGWRIRIKEFDAWYWYLEDGSFKLMDDYNEKKDRKRYLLKDCTVIPYIPLKRADTVVLECVWSEPLKKKIIRKIRNRKLSAMLFV